MTFWRVMSVVGLITVAGAAVLYFVRPSGAAAAILGILVALGALTMRFGTAIRADRSMLRNLRRTRTDRQI